MIFKDRCGIFKYKKTLSIFSGVAALMMHYFGDEISFPSIGVKRHYDSIRWFYKKCPCPQLESEQALWFDSLVYLSSFTDRSVEPQLTETIFEPKLVRLGLVPKMRISRKFANVCPVSLDVIMLERYTAQRSPFEDGSHVSLPTPRTSR